MSESTGPLRGESGSGVNEAPASQNPIQEPPKRGFLSRYGRLLLLVLGVVAVFGLVSAIGPQKIAAALIGVGMWLPLILVLDFGWLFFEQFAILVLLKDDATRVPLRVFWEGLLTHYTTFMIVPMGRASAEVARAGLLSRYIGKSRAATFAALMQSLSMIANALMSMAALLFLHEYSTHDTLSVALLVNVAVTGAVGISTYLVMRHVRIGGALGRRFSKLREAGPEMDRHFKASQSRHWLALVICVGARLLQTLQFAVIFFAVTGGLSVALSFVAEGIQLVGRSAGDMIPNQVGITEGAFTLFASALGLGDAPEQSLSLALVARVSNLTVAGLCALLLQVRPRGVRGAAT